MYICKKEAGVLEACNEREHIALYTYTYTHTHTHTQEAEEVKAVRAPNSERSFRKMQARSQVTV